MAMEDPGLWKTLSGYLWTSFLIPLKLLWDKADNSASKADVKTLFANAELDRKENRKSFEEIQKEMHRIHLDLIHRLSNRHGKSEMRSFDE